MTLDSPPPDLSACLNVNELCAHSGDPYNGSQTVLRMTSSQCFFKLETPSLKNRTLLRRFLSHVGEVQCPWVGRSPSTLGEGRCSEVNGTPLVQKYAYILTDGTCVRLFGERVFPRVRGALNPMTRVFVRDRRGEGHVRARAEAAENAAASQGAPGGTRSWKGQGRILTRAFGGSADS